MRLSTRPFRPVLGIDDLAAEARLKLLGVRALSEARQLEILAAVANFDRFDEGNDPYGERAFGAVEVEGERLFFKIDYFDQALTNHSPDPAAPSVTKRVLAIMSAEEY